MPSVSIPIWMDYRRVELPGEAPVYHLVFGHDLEKHRFTIEATQEVLVSSSMSAIIRAAVDRMMYAKHGEKYSTLRQEELYAEMNGKELSPGLQRLREEESLLLHSDRKTIILRGA